MSVADLARAYLGQGKFAGSEPLAREALEFRQRKQPNDWGRFCAESMLGASLAGQSKYTEAERPLLEGYQGMAARQHQPPEARETSDLTGARQWLAQMYTAWGNPEKAAEWKSK